MEEKDTTRPNNERSKEIRELVDRCRTFEKDLAELQARMDALQRQIEEYRRRATRSEAEGSGN